MPPVGVVEIAARVRPAALLVLVVGTADRVRPTVHPAAEAEIAIRVRLAVLPVVEIASLGWRSQGLASDFVEAIASPALGPSRAPVLVVETEGPDSELVGGLDLVVGIGGQASLVWVVEIASQGRPVGLLALAEEIASRVTSRLDLVAEIEDPAMMLAHSRRGFGARWRCLN